jgi:hypothetical protein
LADLPTLPAGGMQLVARLTEINIYEDTHPSGKSSQVRKKKNDTIKKLFLKNKKRIRQLRVRGLLSAASGSALLRALVVLVGRRLSEKTVK